jgi:hypothetical protein
MPDWKVLYRDDHYRDAQSTHTSKEAAIVQVLHLPVGVRKTRAKPARGLALRALTSPNARGVSHTRRMAAGPKR